VTVCYLVLLSCLSIEGAAAGTPGHGLDAAALRRCTHDVFDQLDLFIAHVRRLARLSMPAADAVRFEHLRPLVRHGLGADLRDFVHGDRTAVECDDLVVNIDTPTTVCGCTPPVDMMAP